MRHHHENRTRSTPSWLVVQFQLWFCDRMNFIEIWSTTGPSRCPWPMPGPADLINGDGLKTQSTKWFPDFKHHNSSPLGKHEHISYIAFQTGGSFEHNFHTMCICNTGECDGRNTSAICLYSLVRSTGQQEEWLTWSLLQKSHCWISEEEVLQ